MWSFKTVFILGCALTAYGKYGKWFIIPSHYHCTKAKIREHFFWKISRNDRILYSPCELGIWTRPYWSIFSHPQLLWDSWLYMEMYVLDILQHPLAEKMTFCTESCKSPSSPSFMVIVSLECGNSNEKAPLNKKKNNNHSWPYLIHHLHKALTFP